MNVTKPSSIICEVCWWTKFNSNFYIECLIKHIQINCIQRVDSLLCVIFSHNIIICVILTHNIIKWETSQELDTGRHPYIRFYFLTSSFDLFFAPTEFQMLISCPFCLLNPDIKLWSMPPFDLLLSSFQLLCFINLTSPEEITKEYGLSLPRVVGCLVMFSRKVQRISCQDSIVKVGGHWFRVFYRWLIYQMMA